jgi:hypothetical protein
VIALDALGAEERARAVHDIAAREGYTISAEDWQHESVGPAIEVLSDEALPDPPRGVALLARGVLVGQQPGIDHRHPLIDRRPGLSVAMKKYPLVARSRYPLVAR